MPKIVAKNLTYLKRFDRQVGELSPQDYRKFTKGQSLLVSRIIPAKGQSLIVEISGDSKTLGLTNGEQWFVYQPQWEVPGFFGGKAIAPKGIRLNAPYFAQNDSNWEGFRQCFSHSCSIAADWALKGKLTRKATERGFSQPENYYNSIREKYGDTTNNAAQIAALRELGIDAYFTQSASPADLYLALQLGFCLPLGVAWKESGHWISLVGMENGNYLMHDPNGARNGAANVYVCRSTDQGREGAFDTYTPAVMDQIYWDARRGDDRDCGWAIFFTAVDTNQPCCL